MLYFLVKISQELTVPVKLEGFVSIMKKPLHRDYNENITLEVYRISIHICLPGIWQEILSWKDIFLCKILTLIIKFLRLFPEISANVTEFRLNYQSKSQSLSSQRLQLSILVLSAVTAFNPRIVSGYSFQALYCQRLQLSIHVLSAVTAYS